MKKNYGVEYETYLGMVAKQGGKCAICGAEPPKNQHKKRLSIDHCHTTGEVRGLLCDPCNRGLGFFRDNQDNLKNAINYLAR